MKKEQIKELKEKLEKSKSSLEETLGSFAHKNNSVEGDWDAIYPKSDKVDEEEKADEVEEYSSLLPIEQSLENKLKKVNEALDKIKNNSYGSCESCGKEIPYEELVITPETKNCSSCEHSK
jgi:RNA polymerase-binding transcription factor DksA